MEESSTIRKSKRSNLGKPPSRYGECTYSNKPTNNMFMNFGNGELQRTPIKTQSEMDSSLNKKKESALLRPSKSDCISVRSKNSRISKASTTESKKRMLEAEIIANERKFNMLEEQQRRINILKKEREEKLLNEEIRLMEEEKTRIEKHCEEQKQLELQLIDLEEELSEHSDEEARSCKTEAPKEKVSNWLQKANKKSPVTEPVPVHHFQINQEPLQDMNLPRKNQTPSVHESYNKGDESRDIVLVEAFKALKTKHIRDLPEFKGSYAEWPNFVSEFERSSKELQLSDNENLRRLNKSLKDKARDTVRMLLNSPENVYKIIDVLRRTFGRKEWIVSSTLEELRNIPNVRENDLNAFQGLYNKVVGAISAIKNINGDPYLLNPELLSHMVEKLPFSSKRSWAEFRTRLSTVDGFIGIEEYSEWLEVELEVQYANFNPFLQKKKENVFKQQNENYQKKQNVFTATISGTQKCLHCLSGEHSLENCPAFKKLNINIRRKKARGFRICFLCLKSGHSSMMCPNSQSKCKICEYRHHEILCGGPNLFKKPETNIKSETTLATFKVDNCLLRIAKIQLRGPGGTVETVALFDDGSTASMIDSTIADKLMIDGPVCPITYKWTHDVERVEEDSKVVQLEVAAGKKNAKFYSLRNVRTAKGLALPSQNFDIDEVKKKYPYIDENKLNAIKGAKPMILIGSNNAGLIVPLNTIQYKIHGLQLCRSHLGWTIHGPIEENQDFENPTLEVNCFAIFEETFEEQELTQLMKLSYKIEQFGIHAEKEKVSEADERALQIMNNTIKKVGNRYEIGHLYKYDNFTFPESKMNAMRRLKFVEARMENDIEFSNEYCAKIDEYVSKGYARKLLSHELSQTSNTWYLPHFGVRNPNKPGKFRLVFDAKAISNGFSLNDLLLQGPDFVPTLLSVIWRARQKNIAFVADIQEMFHQVMIREEDRNSQRFLWRGTDRNRDPDVYVMNAMIFGAVSSPSEAQFVKNENAKALEEIYPGILRPIIKQHYVDDYFDSCSTEEEAIETIEKVRKAHEEGGFKLVKWITNSPTVTNQIKEEIRATKTDSKYGEKVLGMYWNTETDELVFPFQFNKFSNEFLSGQIVPTKKELLSFLMSIYDPVGFLSPLTIKLKIIYQDLWRQNVSWTNKVPETTFERWVQWLNEMKNIEHVTVSRSYFPKVKNYDTVELHVFADAGEKGYCAVAYFRLNSFDSIYCCLIQAKCRVAPLKHVTIPRLELNACVIASQLATVIKQEVDVKISKTVLWTDSQISLSWINSKDKLGPYVGTRVSRILESSKKHEWYWCPSEMNIADLGTKEINDIDLKKNSKWFNGPDFLKLNEKFWPKQEQIMNEIEVVNFVQELENVEVKESMNPSEFDELPNIHRFSKFNRLIRTTAFVIRMKNNLLLKKPDRPVNLQINITDLREAHKLWYRKVQWDVYKDEIINLQRTGYVKKSSSLYLLSPFLHEGILRMKGRIQDETKQFEQLNPIILPTKHRFTELLIEWYHILNLHNGVQTVMSNLMQKYRIPKIRTAVKKSFLSCNHCKYLKAKPHEVEMGKLPIERTTPYISPFTFTGLDYFGPMNVRIGRRTEKRWGALFTCLTTRSVHIELVPSISTSSALMAISRFSNLRGLPSKIFCDNGTCFVGARNELKELLKEIDHTKIEEDLSMLNIQWIFSPPAGPHHGGVWERMVGLVKKSLDSILRDLHPAEEVLNTCLSEVVNAINNRPLTYQSGDFIDYDPICPNQLLIGKINNTQFDIDFDQRCVSVKEQWKKAQIMANNWWKIWIRDYRNELMKRPKWPDNRNDKYPKVGDLVVIVDENSKRNHWPKGMLTHVHPGKDGKIRVVTVKTANGEIKRPITKIALTGIHSL